MPRAARRNADAPGHDSFLDIVANMVGILIILVMVVGVRVKNAPVVTAIAAETEPDDSELITDLGTERSLRGDIANVQQQVRVMVFRAAAQQQRRDALGVALAAAEEAIESRRQELGAKAQRDFDLQRQLSELQLYLEQLRQQQVHFEAQKSAPTVVESYPTPISRTVDEYEVHFQLRAGRVARVPLKELRELAIVDARIKANQMSGSPEIAGTLGPEAGFHVRYRCSRQYESYEFIPVSRDLGETLDEALAEGSAFRRALASFHPDRSTLTIWTYPDSFAAYRRLKKEAYLLGYPTAARLLQHGELIGASSHGNKSVAQ